MTQFRCRKCRQNLELEDAFNEENSVCSRFDVALEQSSIWYIEDEKCPGWILSAIENAAWTKDRLCCPKCNGRLGSFDFLNTKMCLCLQHVLPAVHLLKDRVDIITHRQHTMPNIQLARKLSSSQSENLETNNEGWLTVPTEGNARNSVKLPVSETDVENSVIDNNAQTNEILSNEPTSLLAVGGVTENLSDLQDASGVWTCTEHYGVADLLTDDGVLVESGGMPAIYNQSSQSEHSRSAGASNVDSFCSEEHSRSAGVSNLDSFCSEETDGVDNVVNRRKQKNRNKHRFSKMKANRLSRTQQSLISRQLVAGVGESDTGIIADTFDRNLYQILEIKAECSQQESPSSLGAMKNISDVFEEEVEIPIEFTCSVCLELYYRPHMCLPCEHVFCETCLRELCRRVPLNTPCPLCRKAIDVCQLRTNLLEQISAKYTLEYRQREMELRKLKRNKNFYPLPGTKMNRTWHRQQQQLDYGRPSFVYRVEATITSCLNDTLVRFVWILMVLAMHNILFRVCDWLKFDYYCRNTFLFNEFLKNMILKLLKFGLLHILRKCLGLTFDRRDILGYAVVYAALSMIFMYDSETWTQFIYNMVILGSLFTK